MRIVDRGRLPAGRGRLPVRDWLSEVVPDWLTEVVRPKPAPVPWPDMARAVLAIWAPLAAGLITDHRRLGLLPVLGGLISVMIDNGGPYLARVRRSLARRRRLHGGGAGRRSGLRCGGLRYGGLRYGAVRQRGTATRPAPEPVRRLAATLRVVADAMADGGPPPTVPRCRPMKSCSRSPPPSGRCSAC